ncbi:SixA phosphatase family protein [Sphingobacterium wenxiniae]|uniref:Phosphohistidine phosphatase n=1 Tax=Sphingobacterium wenxiniae TaxID=683125 RepID=A0A1I6VAV9_9SPHI|nr:histidine phosphatase family protein [Sphingobacterium wenxiniae]SFT10772.1 phosphohistidine phosphatase [Sphingobacterium wenxiniae]
MRRKMLYVVRHAKAEDYGMGKRDFDRDLVEKGIARANHIAKKLLVKIENETERTLVISSTANRAAQTAKIFCNILGYPEERIQWEPTFYEAHQLFLLKKINDVPSLYDTVLIFGHNPSVSDFVDYVSDHIINLSTSEVACLQLEDNIDYSSLSANTAFLQAIITEK